MVRYVVHSRHSGISIGGLLCIAHEKRLKCWRREWKFDLIERANPDWSDLYDVLA